jgi:transcriptional regulator with XRE-family HTH domain
MGRKKKIQRSSRYDSIMKTFAKRLKKAREDAGIKSAEAFAHELGVEPHTYRKYERSETEPNFEVLTKICERLKLTPNDLLPEAAGKKRRRGEGGTNPQVAAA